MTDARDPGRDYLEAYRDAQSPEGPADAAWEAFRARAVSGDPGPELSDTPGPAGATATATLGKVVWAAAAATGLAAAVALTVGVGSPAEEASPPAAPLAEHVRAPGGADNAVGGDPSTQRPTLPSAQQATPDAESMPASPVAAPPRGGRGSEPERPRRRRPKDSAVPSTPTASSLKAEMALIGRAKRALEAGQPRKALSLLQRHAKTYPEGLLTEERLVVRMAALCEDGRGALARREAAAFLRAHPRSPLAAHASGACPKTPQADEAPPR